jgi:hypothetical protein
MTGNILGLKAASSKMSPAIPRCPHCQQPIRQYVTQRYNHLINRAVIDEMSKRFVVTGQTDLQDIEAKLTAEELDLEKTRADVTSTGIRTIIRPRNLEEVQVKEIRKRLGTRYKPCAQLRRTIVEVQHRMAERHQPAHKLHEATLHALHQDASLEGALAAIKLEECPALDERDHRITLGARMLQIRVDSIIADDKFSILSSVRHTHGAHVATALLSGKSPVSYAEPLLQSCSDFVTTCREKVLPKLAVEAILYYARTTRILETSGLTESKDREKATKYHNTAQSLLEEATELCKHGFQDAANKLQAVDQLIELLRKEWYEDVTAEELASIKNAMVTGSHGIATHSGHWYNCANGHPVSLVSFVMTELH